MKVVISSETAVVSKSKVDVHIKNKKSIVINNEQYSVTKTPNFLPSTIDTQLQALQANIDSLQNTINSLFTELGGNTTSLSLINSAIDSLNNAVVVVASDGTLNTQGLNDLNAYLVSEIERVTGIITTATSTESLSGSFSQMTTDIVATIENSVAEIYSTKTAVATVQDGVTNLKAVAATFATVDLGNGKKAISGWKSVASTDAPSAFYVYADTFYVVGKEDGSVKPLSLINYIGEFGSHPLPSNSQENSVYKNTIDGNSYILKNGVWSLFLSAGEKGDVGGIGATGADGITHYTWIKYANDSAGSGMSDYPSGKLYIGIAYNKTTATESTTASDYTWALIKGDKGDVGGIGATGADGITHYTWIKYANDSAGSGMSDYPSGKLYIGIAYNKTTATESTTASDYTWALIKGEKGDVGGIGATGATGSRGAGYFSGSSTSATWNNTSAESAITNLGFSKVIGDRVMLYYSTTWTETRHWNGTAWVAIGMLLDGNLLVIGSVTADRVAAENIIGTTISGKVISASNIIGSSGYFTAIPNISRSGSNAPLVADSRANGLTNAIYGIASTGDGVSGASTDGRGVSGWSNTSNGVYGYSVNGYSIYGFSTTATAAGVCGRSGNGAGVYGVTSDGRGVVGSGTSYDFYAQGDGSNYGPFTGGHDVFIDNTSVYSVGDIVIGINVLFKSTVSNTALEVSVSNTYMDKKVFGVLSVLDTKKDDVFAASDGNINYLSIIADKNRCVANAVGEGQINVCSQNGDINNGDYITSSTVAGKGVKQDDDLMHNYTVAKATETVIWANETDGVNGVYISVGSDGISYLTKMIACTYHAG